MSPSGSSVPEAARAAAWQAFFYADTGNEQGDLNVALAAVWPDPAATERFADDDVRSGPKNGEECPRCTEPCAYHEGYDDGASTIQASIPALVAAAVAEERATTGRRIEAAIALHQGAHICTDGSWWTNDADYRGAIANRGDCPTLAALASPGEGE